MDDATEVEPLMSQISKPVKSFMRDGAYDKDKVREGITTEAKPKRRYLGIQQ